MMTLGSCRQMCAGEGEGEADVRAHGDLVDAAQCVFEGSSTVMMRSGWTLKLMRLNIASSDGTAGAVGRGEERDAVRLDDEFAIADRRARKPSLSSSENLPGVASERDGCRQRWAHGEETRM